MRKNLSERIDSTRRRLRRVLWIHGAGWLACGFVAALVIAGMTDWLFHVSSGMRVLLLILAATAWGWLALRFVVLPLSVRFRDLDIALRVERLHPQLGERLSSTVDFLRSSLDDSTAGSRQLRDTVISDALSATESVDFGQIVEARPARRMAVWTAGLLVVALALVAASPSDASIALRRLANPFGGPAWPQRTKLRIAEAPEKVAKGDPFAVDVEVAGVVPNRVMIHYRFAEGEESAPEMLRVTKDGLYRGGFEAATKPFEYSIVGGDAQTEWRQVDVVPAPELTDLRLSLKYPDYTRVPAEEFPEGRGHVRAVVGTKVTVVAHSNKPLERAEIIWDKTGSSPAAISEDGSEVRAEFVVNTDDDYRLVLYDREGMNNALRSPKRYRVNALPDGKPEVTIEQAAGDMEVTKEAVVPIRALVKDDFGIAGIKLHYTVNPGSASNEAAPPAKDAAPPAPAEVRLFDSTDSPKRQLVEYPWALKDLKLGLGSVLLVHASASDLRDLPEPNVGKSREIRLTIVSKDDFLKQIENQQQLIREDLQRVLKLQENALTSVTDLQKQAQIVGELKQPEIDKLQSAEMIQRRIREKIADSEDNMQSEINRLLKNLRDNQAGESSASKSLELIRSELGRISEQHLPPITQSLTRARKISKGEKLSAEDQAPPPQGGKPTPGATTSDTKDVTSKSSDGKSADAKGADAKKAPDATGKAAADKKAAGKSESAKQDAAGKPGEPSSSSGKSADQAKAGDSPGKGSSSGKDSKSGGDSKDGKSGSPSKDSKDSKEAAGDSKDAVAKGEAEPTGEPSDSAKDLGKAREHQQQVVDALSQMLEQLDKWDTVGQVANDARDLQRRQAEVAEQVEKLAKETLGKEDKDLTPQEKASIAKAATRQEDNREQLHRLQRKMDRLNEKLANDDPTTAELLKETLDKSRQDNLTGKMTDAARDIKQNKMGDATKREQEIAKAMSDMVESLENRREQELRRLVKQLKQAEKDLAGMRQDQQRLLQKTKDAEKIADPKEREDELKRLQKAQAELQQKTEEFARRLSRLQAQQASRKSGRAAGKMGAAGQKMQQGQGQQAQDEQEQAAQDLEEAEQQLAQARQQAEQELAQEQLAKIADSIRQIHQREVGMKEEVTRLDTLRQSKGRWSRGELQSLSSLARAQSGLSAETKGLTEKLTEAKVFVLVIEQAASKMDQAADLLGKREAGKPAQKEMDAATRRITQILESLRSDKGEGGKGGGGGGEGGGGGGGGGDGIPNIAQIKLLKALQIEINEQTQELAQVREKGKPTPEEERQFEELSRRQGRLADLIRDLSQPAPEGQPEGEDSP